MRGRAAWRIACWVGWLAVGCGAEESTAPTPEPPPAAGGETTVHNATSLAYTLPAPNLSAGSLAKHLAGDPEFEAVYVTAPAAVQGGLGPGFNHTSCAGCHVRNGRGPESLLLRVSAVGQDERTGAPLPLPGFGGQLQDRAVFGRSPEASIAIDWLEILQGFDDGGTFSLRWPTYRPQGVQAPLPSERLISPRVGPPVFGLGLLEAIPEATLLANAAEQQASGGPVSGRVNYVWDRAREEPVVGRFGWKANEPNLRQQAAHAFQEDMGVTSSLFPLESTAGQAGFDDGLADDPEISDEVLDLTTFYVQTLGVPARRRVDDPVVRVGERIFESVGCATCHLPTLRTGEHPSIPELSDQLIHPYTDLLLHDMGPALDDGRPDFGALPSEWRTPPLWGIGLLETVNGRVELMHDGRARGFLEAILWHGGEAEPARSRVVSMSASEREALVAFLRSL